jgi:hypothetical protein
MSLARILPHAPTPPECDDRSVTLVVNEIPPEDIQPHPFQSETNKLGVFRRYTHVPSWHPKNEERLDLVCKSPSIDITMPVNGDVIHEISHNGSEVFEPFPSISVALYMAAYFSGMDTKSKAHVTCLSRATQHPKFQSEHMANFDAHIENTCLDEYLKHRNHPFQTKNGPLPTSAFRWKVNHSHPKAQLRCYLFTVSTINVSLTLSKAYARLVQPCHFTSLRFRCTGLPTKTSHSSMSTYMLTVHVGLDD